MASTALSVAKALSKGEEKAIANDEQVALFKKYLKLIKAHNHEACRDIFYSQIQSILNLWRNDYKDEIIGEKLLKYAIDTLNHTAFRDLMLWDKSSEHALTTGNKAVEIFCSALQADLSMAQEIHEANKSLLAARFGTRKETALAMIIRYPDVHALMRCGKFQNPKVDKEVKDWYYGLRPTVDIPAEGLVLRYDGSLDIVNWLLGLQGNYWSIDGDPELPCSALDLVNDPIKHKKKITVGFKTGDNLEVVKTSAEDRSFIRASMIIRQVTNDNSSIKFTVEYHFEKLQQSFERIQKSKEFDRYVSSEQVHAVVARVDRVHEEMKEHSEALANETHRLGWNVHAMGQQVQTHAWQIQSTEIGLKLLADNTRLAVETAQIQKYWDTLRQQIALDIPADTFARYLNRGLRKFVGGKELLGEGSEIQRRIGFVEESIPAIISLIAKSVPVFGPVVGAAISGGAGTFFDWRADKLNDPIGAQFGFVNKEHFCDRTALQITQNCRLFNEKRVKNEKDATKLAEYVLASLLYFLSCGTIDPKTVKLEEDLREQIVNIFVQAMTCDNNQPRKALACKKYYEQLIARLESSQPTQKVLMLSNPASSPASSSMNVVVVRPANGLNGNYAASPQIQRSYPYTTAYNGSTNNGVTTKDITPEPVSRGDSKQKKRGCVVM